MPNPHVRILPCAHEMGIPHKVMMHSMKDDIVTCYLCPHNYSYYITISKMKFFVYKDTSDEVYNLYQTCSGTEHKYVDNLGYFHYKAVHYEV